MLEFLRNGYCFAAEMWHHNRIAVAKGNTRRFLNQMHIIATHARHRAWVARMERMLRRAWRIRRNALMFVSTTIRNWKRPGVVDPTKGD